MDAGPESEPPPSKNDALVQGTTNNSSSKQLSGADGTFLPSSISVVPKPINQLDNESSVSGPTTQVASEFREHQNKENEAMELEARCNLYPF